MRIDRIDIEGYGPLAGSFAFPEDRLGLWAAPNEAGKSLLADALVDLFYGPPHADSSPAGWIMARLVRDDGHPLVVARDLAQDQVQITDESGRDVSGEYRDAQGRTTIGERLLGIDRAQFARLTRIAPEDLRATVGDPVLRRLLGHPRHDAAGTPSPSPDHEASPAAPFAPSFPEDDTASPPPVDADATVVLSRAPAPAPEADDLCIIRGAGEELAYVQGGPHRDQGSTDGPAVPSPPARSAEAGAGRAGPEPAAPEPLDLPDIDELDDPTEDDVTRLQRLRATLSALDERLEERSSRLADEDRAREELVSERSRLTVLSGAEPADVEKLAMLLDILRRIQEKRTRFEREEETFHVELAARGLDEERLVALDRRFRDLDETARTFLESYRQDETIRRGNQALVRSESRLDESRIEEIAGARVREARRSLLPFGLAALALFGSIGIRFLPAVPVGPEAILAAGALVAGIGGALLVRGRRLREGERREVVADLARKTAQMEEFDREATRAEERLGEIAREGKLGDPAGVLAALAEWKDVRGDIHDLDRIRKAREEIEREMVKVREKLGSFQAGADLGPDPSTLSAEELEAMHRDYVRFFDVNREIQSHEARLAALENELVGVESRREEIRERVAAILETAGIDPNRDLDEAIARVSQRQSADGVPMPGRLADAEATDGDGTAGSGDAHLDTSWVAGVSARTEAILRRLLPDVREVEVDERLRPSLKLDARGPRLDWRDLGGRMSSASLDQICLALRLAVIETISAGGEHLPLLLDDPLVRFDDSRYDRALDFLVTDAAARGQIVLMTAHEVRSRWFLHQFPQHRARIAFLPERASENEASVPSPPVSSHSS